MSKKISLFLVALLSLSLVACGKREVPEVSVSEPEVLVETIHVEEMIEASVSEVVEEEPVAESDELPTIKDVFAAHGVKAGTCLTASMISNMDQRKIILEQFNSITMENSMKPDYLFNKEESIKTGELVVEFNKDMLKMLDFAKQNNMGVRGHTLIWYSQTPGWIFHENFDLNKPLVGREVMLARMESYIKQVFEKLEEEGYIDLFYAYDIVNEAWMEDGKMRDCDWLKTIGDDYLWQAFYLADKYAPQSLDLYYNDYNEQFKTTALVKFVESLKDDEGNYIIDGVGFQAHLYTNDDIDAYFRNMDAIAALGVKVQLTELDVCLGAYKNPLMADDENLKRQGRFYYNLINGILTRVDDGFLNLDSITFWGFADGLSWRKEYNPLMFDRKFEAKPAFYGVVQIKEGAGFSN